MDTPKGFDPASLTPEEAAALRYLDAALPFGDRIACAPALLLSFARHALRVRSLAPWGPAIPDDIFEAFVLCPRVNNEPIEAHREALFDALWPRVAALSMREAVLEVNFWSLEQATYQPTDERTASPLTVIRRAYGRCGEESTLVTCALRAVGIPARQCYVPRWAHCDDNHAWVEAWVDGSWHYLGACEPEPDLDIGWFTPAASRAMLVRTPGFGWRGSGETMLDANGAPSLLGRTQAYAQTRRLTVTVTEAGRPRPDLAVRFELANMGELFPIHTAITDADGQAHLDTGLGDLHLHVHDGMRHLTHVVDVRETASLRLDFSTATATGNGPAAFTLVPPAERMPPERRFPGPVLEAHQARLAACHQAREAAASRAPSPQGNGREISAFLEDPRFTAEEKQCILDTLTAKDWADITADTLADALSCALPYRRAWPADVWQQAVLAPRVEREALRPARTGIVAHFTRLGVSFASCTDVWAYLRAQIALIDDRVSQGYTVADPLSVLAAGCADARALDLLYVSVCRAFGLPARLHPVTGRREGYAGSAFVPLPMAQQPAAGGLVLTLAGAKPLTYGTHFSIGRYASGVYATLPLGERVLADSLRLPVEAGQYRVLACARQIDGSISVRATVVQVQAGMDVAVPLALPEVALAQLLLQVPLDAPAFAPLHAQTRGHAALWLFIAPGQEPTEHLLGELLALRARIESLDLRILLLTDPNPAPNPTLSRFLAQLPQSTHLACDTDAMQEALRQAMHVSDRRLPLSVALTPDGIGRYALANYNVGIGEALLDILAAD